MARILAGHGGLFGVDRLQDGFFIAFAECGLVGEEGFGGGGSTTGVSISVSTAISKVQVTSPVTIDTPLGVGYAQNLTQVCCAVAFTASVPQADMYTVSARGQ